MQEMDENMMAAKTPEERNAVMAEHRLDMMQTLMEMMCDRLPQTPAKP